jgi:hypothetical protein
MKEYFFKKFQNSKITRWGEKKRIEASKMNLKHRFFEKIYKYYGRICLFFTLNKIGYLRLT